MGTNYWLTGWTEHNRIECADDAMTILSNRAGLDEIIEVAAQWSESPPEIITTDETLLAGPGFDLDIAHHCGAKECRRRDIENLLRHSVHYYSDILMPDVLGDFLASPEPDFFRPAEMEKIRIGIELFFDLKAIGALPLLQYFPRSSGAKIERNVSVNGSSEDVERLRSAESEFGDFLTWGFTFEQIAPGIANVYHSADPNRVYQYAFPLWEPDTQYQSLMVGADLLREYRNKFFETLAHVERFALPVAHADPLYAELERIFYPRKDLPSHTFRMPSLNDIPLNRLIDIRLNNPMPFSQVRNALREATANAPSDDLGSHLDSAVLAPALEEVEGFLTENAKKMRRELGIAIPIVFMTTVITILQGFNLLSLLQGMGGLYSAASPLISAYRERRQQLAENPYSLLWKIIHSHKS